MQIIGHQKNIEFLNKSIKNNKLAHAYLFYGPEHIGKTKVAEYFICNLFCSSLKPCLKSDKCQQILKHFHPDNFWVKENSKTGSVKIEQTRQIKDFVFTSPFTATHKVVIIRKADNLTLSAANSLLKILEEPPQKAILILIAHNFKNLPTTLRSRCQILRFALPLEKSLINFLKREYSFNLKQTKEIVDLAMGRPGLAINFIKNPEEFKREKELLYNIVNYLNKDDYESKFQLTNLMLNSKISLTKTLNILLIILRNSVLTKLKLFSDNYLDVSFKKISKSYSLERLQNFINQVLRTQFLLQANVNKKLAIENLLINY